MIVSIQDDFDLDRIADSGQCFRWHKLDDGGYRILHADQCLYIEDLGGQRFDLSCEPAAFDAVWQPYFDLDENYALIRARIDPAADPFLRAAAEQEKGIRILRQNPWEMLITFIVSQNRNIPIIRRSVELLAAACGEEKTDARGCAYYAFPSAAALAVLPEEKLAACRLGYRLKYVQAAARAVDTGVLRLESLLHADEESTLQALTALYGVGVKVANCVSLFGLHHLNAFPRDVWIKRVLAQEYPQGYPFEQYSPYNGVYQQYMFACYRNRPQNKKGA